MYDLQTAKKEIDAVAHHTGTLTEHVLAVAERLFALEGDFATRLEHLKASIAAIEASFLELRSVIGGGVNETSAVSDLGAKIAMLHNVVHGAATARDDGDDSTKLNEPNHVDAPDA